MEPIEPTATLTSKIPVPHEPADGGDAASGTIGGLPFHLTEKILGCISPLESARFCTVCKPWGAIISERLARPTPHLFALEVLDESRGGAIFSLPIDDGEEDSPAPVALARLPAKVSHAKYLDLCGASPSGSISFASKGRVVLVNPVTGAFRKIKISSEYGVPNFCSGAEAFFVTEFFERSVFVSLWWCTKEEWSCRKLLLPEEFEMADSITPASIGMTTYSDGVFYGMDSDGFIYDIDTHVPPPWGLMRLRAPSILEHYSPICRYSFIADCHLLESEGEVIFVGPALAAQEPAGPESIAGFEVYRLDDKGGRWVEMERLTSDRALFVSKLSSFAVRALETPGCRGNCIYFVHELNEHPCSICGVYSMEERRILFQRPVGGSPGKYRAAQWFFPGVVMPLARAHCSKLRN